MTQSIAHLRELGASERERVQLVRQYLAVNRVSLDLASSIISCAKTHGDEQKKRVNAQDVPALSVLPDKLLKALRMEVYAPVLMKHVLFRHMSSADPEAFVSICHTAVSERTVLRGEDLFRVGMQAKQVHCLIGGLLEY